MLSQMWINIAGEKSIGDMIAEMFANHSMRMNIYEMICFYTILMNLISILFTPCILTLLLTYIPKLWKIVFSPLHGCGTVPFIIAPTSPLNVIPFPQRCCNSCLIPDKCSTNTADDL